MNPQFDNYSTREKEIWLSGYNSGVDDCTSMIYEYKEKHSQDRANHPINYGTLLDIIRWFQSLKYPRKEG